jgi:hypothetical protein
VSELLEVRVAEHGIALNTWADRTDAISAELALALARSDVADARRVNLTAITPPGSAADFGWAVAEVAANPRDWMLVASRTVTYPPLVGVTELLSMTTFATFDGSYTGLVRLDLRDAHVTWRDPRFPDVEILALRPRGNPDQVREWTAAVVASAASLPRLHTLRFLEGSFDDFLPVLAASPLLPQLRVLDATNTMTNRGGPMLLDHAPRFAHLDQIWLGSFPSPPMSGQRRPQRGERDLDDAWRSRLKNKLPQLRFKRPPGDPHLGSIA